MKYRSIISALLFALLSAFGAAAQIRVDAPGVVALNETFNVTFTLNEKASSFEWKCSDEFQVVWGPQTGSSTSISIVNGKTTRNSSYTYTYTLMPAAVGTFSLPAAHAVVGGNDVYSKSPQIEVVRDGSSSAQTSSQASAGSSRNQTSAAGEDNASTSNSNTPAKDMFLRLSLSKTSVVQGEPITATLKLFVRGNVSGFDDAKFPTFNGFWSQEIESPQNISFRRESLSDRIYNTAVLRSWVIIPQKTGSITIEPAELVCLVQQRVSTGNSIFDGFFDDYQTTRRRVVSDSYTVKVSPLPAGAPASFNGAVGNYKITASMSSDSVKVHDAASVKITVSGKGNVALLTAPKVKFPPDSEVYDTKTVERLDAGSGGTSGSKTFEYPFIPRSHGDFTVEPVEFSYYDTAARRYVTISTQAMDLHVAKGDAASYVPADGVSIPTASRKDVRNLSEDIRYISTRLPKLKTESRFFIGEALYWLLLAFAVLVAAISALLYSKVRVAKADTVKVRTRGASKMARKKLSAANAYLQKGLDSAFYEELHKALLGYASDKMNMAASELSKEKIAEAFARGGASEDIVRQYVELLDKCEFARYAPAEGTVAMNETYEKAVDVISAIDSNMKKTNFKSVSAVLVAFMMFPAAVGNAAEIDKVVVDSLWNSAVEAYAAQSYATAAEDFIAVEKMGLMSPELYVNIADAKYKEGDIASAVLYYERALKLDPSNTDAKYNLEIVNQRVVDRINAVPEFFLKTAARKFSCLLPSNVWAILFAAMVVLMSAMVAVFFVSRTSLWRRISFFSALAALLLSIPCITNALWQKHDYERRDSAVVMRAVCSVKNAPNGNSDLFILHEGTRLSVRETVGEWVNIRICDGREGWMKRSDLEII